MPKSKIDGSVIDLFVAVSHRRLVLPPPALSMTTMHGFKQSSSLFTILCNLSLFCLRLFSMPDTSLLALSRVLLLPGSLFSIYQSVIIDTLSIGVISCFLSSKRHFSINSFIPPHILFIRSFNELWLSDCPYTRLSDKPRTATIIESNSAILSLIGFIRELANCL